MKENSHARPHVVRMFNAIKGCMWIGNPLVQYASSVKCAGVYESGRPDGFVCWDGRFLAVEVKSSMGSLYLGDPDSQEDTAGWHYRQRKWWESVAVPTSMSYWIAAWVYGSRQADRIYQAQATLFLIQPEEWINLENLAAAKTVALEESLERVISRKGVTLQSVWGNNHKCVWDNGLWHIPDEHPIRRAI